MSERCEWNPELSKLALTPSAPGDCENEATQSVGAYGEYHLCDSCAELPEFNRFRVRTALKRERK